MPTTAATEFVLLCYNGHRYIAEVGPGAALHRVPRGDKDAAAEIRGLEFRRSTERDDILGWPLFLVKARQV